MDLNIHFLLQYYLQGFWERRWLIAVILWAVALPGWAAVTSLDDQYTARSEVFVDTESLLAPLMHGLTVQPDLERQIEMVKRTLLSRPNLEELIRMADLDVMLGGEVDRNALIGRLSARLRLDSKGDGLFEVRYVDQDPVVAYRVVDALLALFVEQNLGTSRRDMEDARRFIDQQILEYEEDLREAEARLAEFRRRHAAELGSQNVAASRLENAQSELRRLEFTLESAVWRRDQLQAELASTPPTVGQQQAAAGASTAELRVAELQRQLDELRLVYTEQHPDVVATERLLQAAQTALLGGGAADSVQVPNPIHRQLEAERDRLDAEIENLRRQLDLQKEEIARLQLLSSQVPEVEAELAQLNRDYDVIVSKYQSLVERRESARLAQNIEDRASNVEFRIIEPPVQPVAPSGPPHLIYLAAVLIVGAGAGFGAAFLHMQVVGGYQTTEHLSEAFEAPVLGSISPVRTGKAVRRQVLEASLLASALAVLLVIFGSLAYTFHFTESRPNLVALAESTLGRLTGLP